MACLTHTQYATCEHCQADVDERELLTYGGRCEDCYAVANAKCWGGYGFPGVPDSRRDLWKPCKGGFRRGRWYWTE